MSTIPNWKYIRLAIIKLDDYMCRICFSGASDTAFDVHHMDYNRSNNSCSNLVTLCQSCHRAIHMNHYKPENNQDWPPPWKIERPEDHEFDSLVGYREPRKKRTNKPTKYNDSYPWDFVNRRSKL